MIHKAIDIAHVFLKLSHPECGDIVSNLKLQKLLYYAQGFHLAIYGTPLFEDLVEAWNYGPVVPSVYRIYREYETGALPVDNSTEVHCSISDDQLAIIEEVYDVYGQYSGLKLMHLTQHEEPWKATPTGRGNVIDTEKLEQFFRTRL